MKGFYFSPVFIVILLMHFVGGCASSKARPEIIWENYATLHTESETAQAIFEHHSNSNAYESLELGNEIAIKSGDDWTFSPDFVFGGTPDAELSRLETAIYEKSAEKFCALYSPSKPHSSKQVQPAEDSCLNVFVNNLSILSHSYITDIKDRQWFLWTNGLFTTVGDVTFYFQRETSPEPNGSTNAWILRSFCTTNMDVEDRSFICN